MKVNTKYHTIRFKNGYKNKNLIVEIKELKENSKEEE